MKTVFLNSLDAVIEAMVKKKADFASRPVINSGKTWSILKASAHSYKLPFYNDTIFLKIISISIHLLIWKKTMLDFIFIGFAALSGKGRERKIQNENISLRWDSNQRNHDTESQPSAFDR